MSDRLSLATTIVLAAAFIAVGCRAVDTSTKDEVPVKHSPANSASEALLLPAQDSLPGAFYRAGPRARALQDALPRGVRLADGERLLYDGYGARLSANHADELNALAAVITDLTLGGAEAGTASAQLSPAFLQRLRLPGVREAQLSNVNELAFLPEMLPGVERLRLLGCLVPAGDVWGTLARCVNLRELTIDRKSGLSGSGIEQLAVLPHLTSLSFTPHPAALGELGRLQRLEALRLRVDGLSDDDFANLAAIPCLRSLRLDTPGWWLSTGSEGGESLKHLARSATLRVVHVGGGWLTDGGVEHLANVPGLEELVISGDRNGDNRRLSDRSLVALGTMPKLRVLRLHRLEGAVTDAGVAALSKCESLEELHLVETSNPGFLTGQAVRSFGALRSLKVLSLVHYYGELEFADLAHLARSAKRLELLELWAVHVSDYGPDNMEQLAADLTQFRPDLAINTSHIPATRAEQDGN